MVCHRGQRWAVSPPDSSSNALFANTTVIHQCSTFTSNIVNLTVYYHVCTHLIIHCLFVAYLFLITAKGQKV